MNETEDKMKLVTVSRKHFMRSVFWFSFVLFPFGFFAFSSFSILFFFFVVCVNEYIEMRKQIRSMGANHHMQIREISLVSGLYEQFSYCPLSFCNRWYLYCVSMCFYFLIRCIFAQAVLGADFPMLISQNTEKKNKFASKIKCCWMLFPMNAWNN